MAEVMCWGKSRLSGVDQRHTSDLYAEGGVSWPTAGDILVGRGAVGRRVHCAWEPCIFFDFVGKALKVAVCGE